MTQTRQTRLFLAVVFILFLTPLLSSAPRARYDYYLTGSAADAAGDTKLGVGLMGGGTDVDALFTWMSDRAGGGDFVVIRASGADGYNPNTCSISATLSRSRRWCC